uniref:Uncharacterized protein n=1 Tax=Kalanchoe fedtschenkoi TaxID=63787 RepID=A0A7N0REW1_KALFE
MEITVLDRSRVFPSEPPFAADHVLPLSSLDTDPNLHVIVRYLRVYKNASNASEISPFETIAECLSKALVYYYQLAGTLRRHDGRLELLCSSSHGATLIKATANRTLSSLNYLDDPAAHFVEQLAYDPDVETGLDNPFTLQVTRFECGGFALGATVHHALCDGMGSTQFFNAMAELARGLARPSADPVWDRAGLLGPRDPPRVEFPVSEVLGLDKELAPYSRMDNGPVVRECFDVKDEDVERFKEDLFEQCGVKFTTFEALGAYIWRARVKIAGVPDHEKVKFAYSLNIRKLVKPPLPGGYWGNGCVPMYVQLTAKEVVENPIWETAGVIRESKRNATDEYVRSFIDFQEINFNQGVTAGKGVSGFTDWRHLGHSTLDFGWGGPVTVLPLASNLLGSTEPCFFLPHSSANAEKKDGFKVLVCLPLRWLPAFREEMRKLSACHNGAALAHL